METNIYKIFYLFLLHSENIRKYYNHLISNYYHIFHYSIDHPTNKYRKLFYEFSKSFQDQDNTTYLQKYQELYLCHYSNHSFILEKYLDKDVVSIILNFL